MFITFFFLLELLRNAKKEIEHSKYSMFCVGFYLKFVCHVF